MTDSELRDWFAGMAMQGALASWTGSSGNGMESVAKQAYQRADWMMKARQCTPDQLKVWETKFGDGHVHKVEGTT